jgi:hypothetical protein
MGSDESGLVFTHAMNRVKSPAQAEPRWGSLGSEMNRIVWAARPRSSVLHSPYDENVGLRTRVRGCVLEKTCLSGRYGATPSAENVEGWCTLMFICGLG